MSIVVIKRRRITFIYVKLRNSLNSTIKQWIILRIIFRKRKLMYKNSWFQRIWILLRLLILFNIYFIIYNHSISRFCSFNIRRRNRNWEGSNLRDLRMLWLKKIGLGSFKPILGDHVELVNDYRSLESIWWWEVDMFLH